jgi:hypothetical protein
MRRRDRVVPSDVLDAVKRWKQTRPAFAAIWDAAEADQRRAYLAWMSEPRWKRTRDARVKAAVRDALEFGDLAYVGKDYSGAYTIVDMVIGF